MAVMVSIVAASPPADAPAGAIESAISRQPARFHVLRLKPGQDLVAELDRYARARGIQAAAVVSAVGSLRQARIRYANQPDFTGLQGPFEIVSFSGTLDARSRHLHLAIADGKGATRGGHVESGCLVFTTAELVIAEFPDLRFDRKADAYSGYEELTMGEKRR